MPPKSAPKSGAPNGTKRKAPASFDKAQNPRTKRQNTQRDARTLAAQTTSKAFKNGELDVDKFVKAREYEIRALEEGLQRSKKALTQRAFQQVPKDLRRRTASHNAARVPKRLRDRAKQEMKEDNTPTVTARRRKLTGKMRLRAETVKKLRAMGAKKREELDKRKEKVNTGVVTDTTTAVKAKTREPRVKKNQLRQPPVPKAKFRKRQLQKSWLPTHLFHAKRAKMTPSMEPLWRFAIPLTPSLKCYRPTHRAASERGAVAWDVSYMATMRLEGVEKSIEGLLKELGITQTCNGTDAFGPKGRKWRNGTRTWQGWLFERDGGIERPSPIAPVTIIWRIEKEPMTSSQKTPRRAVFVRVHPSAFLQLWEQITRLCKVQKPQVVAEDLRFEIGSIEIRGPASTEALQGALWPVGTSDDGESDTSTAGRIWKSLNGVQDSSSLPANAMLSFSIQDPRLHHPPRTVKDPPPGYEQQLLQVLADWSADSISEPQAMFDSKIRRSSSKCLPSQKAINRRKGASPPGQYPEPLPTDPRIPVMLYATRSSSDSRQASWTVMLPWKAVNAVWYSIMYYPLSTGGQVRLGGLQEQRQLAFESGTPWFPGDFPGTNAGDVWNEKESARREAEWKRRPKGKRAEFSSTDVGFGGKGEIGEGWACDWKMLLNGLSKTGSTEANEEKKAYHIDAQIARSVLIGTTAPSSLSLDFSTALTTVRIEYMTGGVPSPCARVYRLPRSSTADTSSDQSSGPTLTSISSSDTGKCSRDQWLSLLPSKAQKLDNHARHESRLPVFPKNATEAEIQKRLAAYLMMEPTSNNAEGPDYPKTPGEQDLIGFVTTGEFCLSQGKGVGIASVLLSKVMDDASKSSTNGKTAEQLKVARGERQLCIVRNAGESIGRLARWEIV